MVGRELTKHHEELVKQPISEVLSALVTPRGEFTVVIGPVARRSLLKKEPIDSVLLDEFYHLTYNEGLSRRAGLAILAKRYGKRTRDVYASIERLKRLGPIT